MIFLVTIFFILKTSNCVGEAFVLNEQEAVVRTRDGFPLVIDRKDGLVSQIILKAGYWEPKITCILRKLLKKGDTVLHLGTHIGYEAVIISELIGSEGKAYGFEPDPISFAILQKNIILNEFDHIYTCFNLGVGDEKSIKFFQKNQRNTGNNHITDENKSGQSQMKIQVVKLDEFLVNTVNKIDFIFMDVEGYELKALQGLTILLEKSPDCIILTEWNIISYEKQALAEFINKLLNSGHKFYEIENAPIDKERYIRLNTIESIINYQKPVIDLLIVPAGVNVG